MRDVCSLSSWWRSRAISSRPAEDVAAASARRMQAACRTPRSRTMRPFATNRSDRVTSSIARVRSSMPPRSQPSFGHRTHWPSSPDRTHHSTAVVATAARRSPACRSDLSNRTAMTCSISNPESFVTLPSRARASVSTVAPGANSVSSMIGGALPGRTTRSGRRARLPNTSLCSAVTRHRGCRLSRASARAAFTKGSVFLAYASLRSECRSSRCQVKLTNRGTRRVWQLVGIGATAAGSPVFESVS